MPRRSSRGRLHSGRSAARAQAHNPPRPVAASPPPAPPAPAQSGSGSMLGGIGASIADGMAWGTGTAIARRAVDAVMGPAVVRHETVASSAPSPASAPSTGNLQGSNVCGGRSKAVQDCLNNYGSDISKCQFYMDMLHECRKSSGVALSA